MTPTRDPAPHRPLRILCDVDGVLADFVGLCLDVTERHYGLRYARECVDQWDVFVAMNLPDGWKVLRHWVDAHQACRTMPAFHGARQWYAELRQLGHVHVATSPLNAAWMGQRAAWLEAFGIPLEEQKHLHEKAALAGGPHGYDVLIDDRTENCEDFVAAGGLAWCLAAPYNADVRTPRGTHAECLEWLRALAATRARVVAP